MIRQSYDCLTIQLDRHYKNLKAILRPSSIKSYDCRNARYSYDSGVLNFYDLKTDARLADVTQSYKVTNLLD